MTPIARILVTLLASCSIVGPGVAQTDDRINNDALALLGVQTVVKAVRDRCIVATNDDPQVRQSFEVWNERNGPLVISLVSLIGARGGAGAETLDALEAEKLADVARNFGAAATEDGFCSSFAHAVDERAFDLANTLPDESRRVTEAMADKWPPLDVANAQPVADAMQLNSIISLHRQMTERCGVLLGEEEAFGRVHGDWVMKNIDVESLGDQLLKNWGALATWRPQQVEADAEIEVWLRLSGDDAQATCRKYAVSSDSGEHDFSFIEPDLLERLRRDASRIP